MTRDAAAAAMRSGRAAVGLMRRGGLGGILIATYLQAVAGILSPAQADGSGPLGSLEHCVDRFPEAARRFLGREPEQVRWGKRI